MFDVIAPHLIGHDPKALGFALAVCAMTCVVGVMVAGKVAETSGKTRLRWCGLAGVALGFGVWATHFMAMVAWNPGFVLGYDLYVTVLSLAIGCTTMAAALRVAVSRAALGGVVLGGGVAAMHMTGMSALRYQGLAEWDEWRLITAIAAGTWLMAVAMSLGMWRTGLVARIVAGVALGGGICVLHFGAMTAIDLSACMAIPGVSPVAGKVLEAAAGIAAMIVLSAPLLGIFLEWRDRRLADEQTVRLNELANLTEEGLMTIADGVIATCNARLSRLSGYGVGTPVDALLNASTLDLLRSPPGEVRDVFLTTTDGVIPVSAVLHHFQRDGRWVEAIALRDLRRDIANRDAREESARARLDAERKFRLLVQNVTDYAIYMLDTEGRVANWNAGAQRNKGYSADEIIGRHFSTFYSHEDRATGLPQKMLARALEEGRLDSTGWRYRKDGSRFWATVSLEPMFDEVGVHIGFSKVTRDITRQREDAEAIRQARLRLTLALENMSQGIALFDQSEVLVLGNARLSAILGASVPQGQTLDEFSAMLAGMVDLSSSSLEELHARHRQLWHGAKGGDLLLDLVDDRTIMIVHRPVREGGWVTTIEDVSDRTRSERQISHMARHDALTGLPNRTSFREMLDWALDGVADVPQGKLAVIGIDLDRFKEINDHLGHAAGDIVLTTLSRRIMAVMTGDEVVARFGGDEFAAFKPFSSEAEVEEFLQRLDGAICGDVDIDGSAVSVGVSMGIAHYPEDGRTIEKLIANADLAMYRAKASLTEKICRYESRMDEASRDRQAMARDLWRAVERGEFYLHHQIQKSVSTGATTGYEVLLRWNHPERGSVSPAEFIPIAEECGAIMPIGEWVLRSACQQAAAWSNQIRIAVNLSPVQLSNPRFVNQLQEILAETGIDPVRLELEVTETTIIADKDRALHMLNQIKALGVTIAIDDFGTGYSSLETLRSFPFDKIKLDRSFIREADTNAQAKAIIRAILALGRSLEVPVLAEGVETMAQLTLLRTEGCDEAQGYYLGRPGIIGEMLPGMVA